LTTLPGLFQMRCQPLGRAATGRSDEEVRLMVLADAAGATGQLVGYLVGLGFITFVIIGYFRRR
jgi:hypothetical protein